MHSNHFRNMLDWSMDSSAILSWDGSGTDAGAVGGSSGLPNGNVRGLGGGGAAMDSLCSSYYDMPSSLASSMMSSMASACLTPCTPVRTLCKFLGADSTFLYEGVTV